MNPFNNFTKNNKMKKILLIALLAITGLGLFAQKLEKAKDLLKSNKLADAKAEIDKVLADPKNEKNAEAVYTKAKILGAIANDNALAAQTPDARLQSFELIKKYVGMEEKLLSLTLDNYKPVMDAYQGFFKAGAALFGEGKQAESHTNFKNCLAVSEYMSQKGWTNVKLDTTVILYSGITAEKSERKDDAAGYYAKLADAKVTGEGMVEIYKWLADYYNNKKDTDNSIKYLTLGKELYPKDGFWDAMEIDMLSKKEDKKALFAKYKDMIAKNPSDHLPLYNYAVENYLFAYTPELDKRPAGSAEMIDEAESSLKKVLELKPDYGNAMLLLGQIAFNKGVDLNNQSKTIRPPAGGKLKPEDLKKKQDLRAMGDKKFDEAIPYFEKLDELLGAKGKLPMEEKKGLKDAYDLLITIFENKAKPDKVKIYEEKFNNVEKVH
jgi:tetratricopeptide (TPR) repeat protein